jgi:acyl-coenzyme A synthetase/AMP-(fatty) acid ligase
MQDGPLAWAESWARETPDDIALLAPGLTLTAGELWDIVLRISVAMADASVEPGELTALAGPLPFRPILTLAALARGALGIGIGPGAASTVSRVIAFEPVAGFPAGRTILLDLAALGGLHNHTGRDHPGFGTHPDAPALAVSSSGTTGAPKAVVFSLGQLVERVAGARRSWILGVPFASLLGPASMIGQVSFFAALQRRSAHIVPGDAATNLAQLRDHGIQVIMASPSQLSDLLRSARKAGEHLDTLTLVLSAGSPISASLVADVAGWFGVEVQSGYGATEAGTVAFVEGPMGEGVAARVLPGAEVQIVDADGSQLPDGSAGRIRMRTDGIASGYLGGHDDASDRGFRDGWFLPGDLGMIVDGGLTLLGRDDDLLNAAGVKVSAARIEALARALPGIRDAVACAVLDGHGARLIGLAFVGDASANPAGIVAALRGDLGDAAPRIIVRLAEFPLTESGKVARASVAELVQARFMPPIEI